VTTGPPDSEARNNQAGAGPWRVLLAEDDIVNQEITRDVLNRMGHEAKIVENGREALDAAQAQHFDVVLMDVWMPEMNGLEASRRIREARPRGGQLCIVALTANETTEVRERCLEAGMDAFLNKPVRQDELAEVFSDLPPSGPGASGRAGRHS